MTLLNEHMIYGSYMEWCGTKGQKSLDFLSTNMQLM